MAVLTNKDCWLFRPLEAKMFPRKSNKLSQVASVYKTEATELGCSWVICPNSVVSLSILSIINIMRRRESSDEDDDDEEEGESGSDVGGMNHLDDL